MDSGDEYLTEEEKIAKSVKISKIKTITQTVSSFKKHTGDILKICNGADVATYLETLTEVVETSREIDGVCEAMETKHRKNERVNAAALGNIILEKYKTISSDKYNNFCK